MGLASLSPAVCPAWGLSAAAGRLHASALCLVLDKCVADGSGGLGPCVSQELQGVRALLSCSTALQGSCLFLALAGRLPSIANPQDPGATPRPSQHLASLDFSSGCAIPALICRKFTGQKRLLARPD